MATGLVVAAGWLIAGLFLLTLAGALDLLDGAVAKASATSTPRGAFFDSVSDRVSDAFVLAGVAWYLASWKHGHYAILALAVYARSTKEGQYYLMPLTLLTMVMTFLSVLPGAELSAVNSLLPITGASLLLQRSNRSVKKDAT